MDSPIRPFPEKAGKFSLKSLLNSQEDDNYYDYWAYTGSTTSPPCSHNTKWIVFMDTFPIGLTFLEMLKGSQYTFREQNAQLQKYYSSHRTIQEREDRLVGIYINREKKELSDDLKGHFEQVTTQTDKYFYQPGKLSSGFSGASPVTYNDLYKDKRVTSPRKALIAKASQ